MKNLMKNLIVAAVAIFAVLLVQACANPYSLQQSLVSFDRHYGVVQLNENVFKISFTKTGRRATHFAMLRCAELTLKNGRKYFAIADYETVSSTSGTQTTHKVVLHAKKPASGFAYNAEYVRNSVKAKYGI